MDNKKLGIILVIIGILLIITIFFVRAKEDALINKIVAQEGTCFLEDETCLHEDRNISYYIIAWIISALIVALGGYLIFFEKSQRAIISTLEKQKHLQIEEEKFDILLKGLHPTERKVIKAVKDQDGITQQTLRLRTDLHKSKLSIILDGLEKKNLIKRIKQGKTKQVFLKINI